jgi:hypothetical protein
MPVLYRSATVVVPPLFRLARRTVFSCGEVGIVACMFANGQSNLAQEVLVAVPIEDKLAACSLVFQVGGIGGQDRDVPVQALNLQSVCITKCLQNGAFGNFARPGRSSDLELAENPTFQALLVMRGLSAGPNLSFRALL